uniref:NADH dehydrogenase subunit 5 n=1 Tax=Ornithodoros tartakovskyi TaxID=570969 RepID=UPI0022370F2E|nr:NADH dehydrogenase subunit 5 [Ornithodoros tartakovskyi]UYB78672.1 NADH dehydrogenase subunit 5 [Ornithodoros tartakovskyi]UYB78685.1 NADH dehydrogenase subunit 5 [Ornithodoros tartakovskyi]
MFFYWGFFLLILSGLGLWVGLWMISVMSVVIFEYYLLTLGNWEIKVFFLMDWISMMFVGVVLFISSMVIMYSNDYMGLESRKDYFCYGVLLFVGSMIMMIISPNLLMILLGWDGLGLVSYCLVIYYQNYKSDSAGMVTVLSNRVGDVMILLSVAMLVNMGTFDFYVYNNVLMLAGFMILVAGMTKSAQIPFSAWLPAAMAAPTPVSSLVHSSTLVTAGVYLLIRFEMLFQISYFSKVLMYFSLMTMIMSGVGAIMEMDLKKIIALSTLSQLGLMMLILSMGEPELAFFHLLTHAVFKAMLFLCAGFMIHSSLLNQDIRFMGGFFKTNPLMGISFGLANMSLFGIPFLSGFFSKDLILEYIYMEESNLLIIVLVVVATFSTCFYSLRVMYYSMLSGVFKLTNFNYCWSIWMEIPIFVMGFVVVCFGSSLSWVMMLDWDGNSVLNFDVKIVNIVIIMVGLWGFWVFISGSILIMDTKVSNFLGSMWFLSFLTSDVFLKSVNLGQYFLKNDMSWLEEFGPQGAYSVNLIMGGFAQWVQLSSFKDYLFFMMVILICLY